MKKKNRQNFTIDDKISNEFKKVCEDMSVNMSQLIETYMEEYVKLNNLELKLKNVFDNLDIIKVIAQSNYKENEYGYLSLNLSEYVGEDIKARKIITRIIHTSNIIAVGLRCGPANVCILHERYYNLISKYLIEVDGVNFLGDIKIVKNNDIGDFILSMRLMSNDFIRSLINTDGERYDIKKQYAGFEVID